LGDGGVAGRGPARVAVGHRVATAAGAELAGHGGGRGGGRDGAGAVAGAVGSPPAAPHRRGGGGGGGRRAGRGGGRGAREERRGEPGDLRGLVDRPGRGARGELVDAGGVGGEEAAIGVAAREQRRDRRERDRQVGTGAQREVEIGAAGQRRGARIDDDELGAR